MAQEPAAVRKDSIVVTGLFEPAPLEEADRAVNVIELDEAGKLLSNTVFDYLRLIPSLDVRSRAPNGVQTDLSIRGGDFGQTVVLLDGVRLNDAQSGHHNLDIPVPPSALQRVEVLKGAGSAFYGSEAIGGVVNLITREPETAEVRLRTAVGNFGVNQQSGDIQMSRGPVHEQLFFSRDFTTGFQADRDYRNLSLTSLTRFRSRLGDTGITLASNDRPFGADQFYGNYNSWERTRTWYAAIRQAFGKKTEASFAFRRHTDMFVLYRDRPQVFTNRHGVEGYQSSLRRHDSIGSKATLSYGGEGYREVIDSNNLGNHQRNHGAVYAALDIRAFRRYSFTLGGREELFRGGARQFNPTASMGVWLAPHWKARASASRAFRLPSYTDLYYHDPANLGSPYLKPESAWSYDGAVEWTNGGRLRADAGVFHRRLRDGIDFVRASPTDLYRATNFTRVQFTGVEANVKARVAKTQWVEVSYTGLHGVTEAVQGIQSKYIFNYPVQDASISWQATLPKGFLARTRVGVMSRYARDPYGLWDVYVAERRGHWTPFAQFTNLTSTSYQEVVGVAMPGRAALAGLEWKSVAK